MTKEEPSNSAFSNRQFYMVLAAVVVGMAAINIGLVGFLFPVSKSTTGEMQKSSVEVHFTSGVDGAPAKTITMHNKEIGELYETRIENGFSTESKLNMVDGAVTVPQETHVVLHRDLRQLKDKPFNLKAYEGIDRNVFEGIFCEVDPKYQNDLLEVFYLSSNWSRVSRVHLIDAHIDSAADDDLGRNPNLNSIHYDRCDVDESVVGESLVFERVKELEFTGSDVRVFGYHLQRCKRLERISFTDCALDGASIESLSNRRKVATIRLVQTTQAKDFAISDDLSRALSKFNFLTLLDLSGTHVTPASIRIILSSDARFKVLLSDLDRQSIGAAGIANPRLISALHN